MTLATRPQPDFLFELNELSKLKSSARHYVLSSVSNCLESTSMNTLKWDDHIKDTVSGCNASLSMLRKLKHLA